MINTRRFFSIGCTAIIFALFISCKEDSKPEEKEEPVMMSFEQIAIDKSSLEQCKDSLCPTININSLTAKGDSNLSKTVNDALNKRLTAYFIMSPEEEDQVETLDQGINSFIKDFRDFKTDFPDTQTGYEMEATTSVSYQSAALLSLAIESYSYWGGAHGYGSTSFLNFNKETGKQLTNDALFKDKKAFLAIAEKKFRAQQDIPADQYINYTGYMFEDDVFALPENIGFQDNEIVLIYNPYEIAAYAEGIIELRIELNEIKDLLAVNL